MKNKLIFTGVLSLFLFGLVGCQEAEKPGDSNTSTVVPSTNDSKPTDTTRPSKPLEPYYEGLDVTKTGKEFIDKLSIIINRGAHTPSYDDAYDYLTVTDADPLNPGHIKCFYTGVSYLNGVNGNDRLWNREHVWAKSHGFNDKKYAAYSDLHHLRATESGINSARNDRDFNNVTSGEKDKYGNSWDEHFFEPRDEVKGDVARILFYMSVKYSSGDLKLNLTDEVPTSPSKNGGSLGKLSTLLEWHEEDPVSIEEVKRNEEVFKIQNNRNPFIDHPEFASNVFNTDVKLPDNEVVEDNVVRVQGLIDALPNEIDESNKHLVIEANEAYDKLSLDEKKLIKDEKLIEALIKLEELNNKPDEDMGDIAVSVNLAEASVPVEGKYAQNGTIDAGGYEFFATSYWMKAGLTIGENDKGFSIDLSKFGISGVGSYLEQKFITNNATSISIEITKTYANFGRWYIFFTEEGTNTPVKVAEGTEGSQTAKAKLDSPKNGYFTFVVEGNKSRALLGSLKIGVKNQ